KSAQIREILISESAWEEMTCLFAPSIRNRHDDSRQSDTFIRFNYLGLIANRLR
ncbi:dibenzothiophene desulfurase, partial [Klebsiella pneumoniae]